MNQRSRRVTLKDIADECSCSVNTVSRALRNDLRLSADTINRIQITAKRLGYVRNALASSLRSGKSHIIAAIVDNIQNPYYASIVSHLDMKLREYDYSLMILCNQTSQELTVGRVGQDFEREIIDMAIAHGVDGIVFFPYINNCYRMAMQMIQNHIPFVQVGREIAGLEADTDIVRCDDYAGGYLAGKELIRLGHRRLLYVAGDQKISSQVDRQKGFLDAASDNGVPLQDIRIISEEDMLRSILRKSVLELLSPVDYTAVFSFNDHMAYSVVHCLQSADYHVPGDISVIGFDNIQKDVPYALPISSIGSLPEHSFVHSIIELLLSRIEDPSLPARSVIFPVMLYDGGTHGVCRK